jgi:hypothetical protein
MTGSPTPGAITFYWDQFSSGNMRQNCTKIWKSHVWTYFRIIQTEHPVVRVLLHKLPSRIAITLPASADFLPAFMEKPMNKRSSLLANARRGPVAAAFMFDILAQRPAEEGHVLALRTLCRLILSSLHGIVRTWSSIPMLLLPTTTSKLNSRLPTIPL